MPRGVRAWLLAGAALVTAAPFAFCRAPVRGWRALAVETAAALVYLAAARAILGPTAPALFGLRARPAGGYARWARVGLLAGAGVLAVSVLATIVARALGAPISLPRLPWATFWSGWLPEIVVLTPIAEELIFRAVLCSAVELALGARAAIAVSGVAFAALHVVAGVASPDNQVAGFLFAWAFVRSRSLIVPLAFHAVGNLAVGLLLASR